MKEKKAYKKPEVLKSQVRSVSKSACGLTSYGHCGSDIVKRT